MTLIKTDRFKLNFYWDCWSLGVLKSQVGRRVYWLDVGPFQVMVGERG